MTTEEALGAALAAFNPAAWPVHVLTRPEAAAVPADPAIVIIRGANDPAFDRLKRRFIEIGIVGGADPAWIGATVAPPLPPGESGALIVSFYTRATRYEAYAERLRASLDAQGVTYDLVGVEVSGSWEMVCAFKAEFVRDQWRKTGRPVIWLDADSTLEGPPGLLAAPGADFAISKHVGWKFCTGSALFGRSAAAEALLDRWVLRCQADPLMWDQNHLDAAWADVSSAMPLVTRWLPQSYYAVQDSYDATLHGPPVVLQHQASRGEGRRKTQPPPPAPDALRNARRASRWVRGDGSQFRFGAATVKPSGSVSPALAARLRAAAGGSLPLVDICCGAAGIGAAFAPGEYIGTDIRPEALLAAREAMPAHRWRLLMEEHPYPAGGSVLLLDLLAHVPAATLPVVLGHAAGAAARLMLCDRLVTEDAAAAIAASGWQAESWEAVEDGRILAAYRRG